MSYDELLGYDPDRPVLVRWEGDLHPEQARTTSFEFGDGGVYFTDDTEAFFVPMHRIYSIKRPVATKGNPHA